MKARIVAVVGLFAALAGTAACGLLIGLEDHEAYPAEGGVSETGPADHTAGETGPGEAGHDAAGDAGADGPAAEGGCAKTTCGTSCVDLQTDPNNCGSCGHSCSGSPCYGATCSGNSVVGLAAGASHDCVLLQAGEVWCWGADDKGQVLGASSDAGAPDTCPGGPCRQPKHIPGLPAGVKAIAAGGDQTCAVDADGGVWCWGANPSGGLGHAPGGDPTCTTATGGTVPCNAQPSQVGGLPGAATAVSAGQTGFACAVVGGNAYCWGDDTYHQLGPGGSGSSSPTPVLAASGVSGVSAGYTHTCSLAGTTASCWGSNEYGELGHTPATGGDSTCTGGVPCNSALQAVSLSGVLGVHAGHYVSCLDTGSGPSCFGMNDTAQLGRTTSNTNPNPAPAPVTITNATAIVATDIAHKTACAIALSQAHCWGNDETHQTSSNQQDTCGSTPCITAGYTVSLFDVVEVKTSPYVTIARTLEGKAYAWGWNGFGQLGHSPNTTGDSAGCDPAAFDGGTVCNGKVNQVGGLP